MEHASVESVFSLSDSLFLFESIWNVVWNIKVMIRISLIRAYIYFQLLNITKYKPQNSQEVLKTSVIV